MNGQPFHLRVITSESAPPARAAAPAQAASAETPASPLATRGDWLRVLAVICALSFGFGLVLTVIVDLVTR